MIAEFDADKNSLYQAWDAIRSHYQLDTAIAVLREEYGFQLPADIPLGDLEALIARDREGTERTWSAWREYDTSLDFGTPPAPRVQRGPPYSVIYADPPWPYTNKRTGGNHKSGAVQHYSTMTMQDIQRMDVAAIASPASVLFLWATVPMLPEAFATMEAWGWKYKTLICWLKQGRMGLGYWLRGEVEVLLFGIRGKVKAFRSTQRNFEITEEDFAATWIPHKRQEHSRKPDIFRKIIENVTAGIEGARVELFARDSADGWDVWGDEVSSDAAVALKPAQPEEAKEMKSKRSLKKKKKSTTRETPPSADSTRVTLKENFPGQLVHLLAIRHAADKCVEGTFSAEQRGQLLRELVEYDQAAKEDAIPF